MQQLTQRKVTDADDDADQSQGVGLAQAKKIALLYNPTMRAARLNARVPVVSATQAGLLDDPELGIDVTRLVQFADNPWTVGSSLAMTLPLSGRLALERQTATAEGSAALVEAWTIEQQVLHQLELEWIEGASTRRAIEEANQAHRQIDEVVEITNRLESVGEMITAEAVAFRVEQSKANLETMTLHALASESDARLLAMMGLNADAPIAPRFDMGTSDAAISPAAADVITRNPTVLLREAEYEVSERSLRHEVRKQYPDLTLGPSFEREGNMQDTLGFGLSLPLPILNANRRAIAEARARRAAMRGAWEEAIEVALAEHALLSGQLRAIEERREYMRGRLLELADQQLAEARRLANLGEVNALLLLEALQTRHELALDAIKLDTERARILADLRALAPENTLEHLPNLPTNGIDQ
jgi:cobalt-zinc-cadmium efflux system outer membrane protein